MTGKQALAEAVKRWGKKAAVQDRGKKSATTPESRAQALIDLRELRKMKPETPRLSDRERWPDETPIREFRLEHVKAVAEIRRHREEESRLQSECWSRRFSVGLATWAFEVYGSGDTWDEAFAEADKRKR